MAIDYTNSEIATLAKAGGYSFKTSNGLDAVLYSLENPLVFKVRIACEKVDNPLCRISPDDQELSYWVMKVTIEGCETYVVFDYWTEAWRIVSIFTRHFRQFIRLSWTVKNNLLLAVVDGKAYPYHSSLAGRAVHQAIVEKVTPKIAALISDGGNAAQAD